MGKLKNFRIKGNNKEVRKHIKDLCEQIVDAVNPRKIILFGSYAYGQPTEDSDIDLFVVMPFEVSPHRQAANIRILIERPEPLIPLDILVRTPEQVEERIRMGDPFMKEIVEEGKVLYESDYSNLDRPQRRGLDLRAA